MRVLIAAAAALAFMADPALARAPQPGGGDSLDLLWITLATCLVLLMQAGFLLIEAGTVRSKNSISVAFRHLVNFVISIFFYIAVGFGVMYGVSVSGLFGAPTSFILLSNAPTEVLSYFLFNAAFCGIAMSIVSGVVAERMSLRAFALTCAFVSTIVYPVFGHWAWGAGVATENTPFLASIGFYDFAGATVVHSIGAWAGLAGALVLGPRLGRYRSDGGLQRIHGHSKVYSGLGLLCLIIGWLGYAGGSEGVFDAAVPTILVNTILGGISGGAIAAFMHIRRFAELNPDRLITGTIAGLVSVTAAADIILPLGAVLLGGGAAVIESFVSRFLARRRVDDVVGAVSAHGAAGAWGTIAFVLAAPVDALPLQSVLDQALVQALGVAVALMWGFGLSWIWFKVLSRIIMLRVSDEDEFKGLNVAEHGAELGVARLAKAVSELADGDADLSLRMSIEPGDEAHGLAEEFNRLLARLEAKELGRRHLDHLAREKEAAHQREEMERVRREQAAFHDERRIVQEISDFIGRAADGDLGSRLSLHDKTGVLGEVAGGVNKLIDGLSESIGAIAQSAESINGACGRLADVSDELRIRSATQIDSVQSVTFRLSTMAEAANQSTEYAEDALGVANETREVADVVHDGVERIETAMNEIERSAAAIAPVVEMIEEIAFKTNLLAINAAVEAARAGDAGASFSVVAHEVRTLANNTQNFADEIGSMVKTALGAVRQGASVVEATSGRVKAIHETAERVSEQIDKIHAASSDQRNKLNSLYDAVSAIADVSSGNARLASETASASAQLAGQGGVLLDSVKNFSGFKIVESIEGPEQEKESSSGPLSIELF